MILQALYEYYQRKESQGSANAAPQGFQWQELPYLIVISNEGNFIALENTKSGDKKSKGKRFLVPIAPVRAGKVIRPGLLWDQTEYVLGMNPENKADVFEKHASFKLRIQRELAGIESSSLSSLSKFLDNNPCLQIANKLSESEWQSLQKDKPFIAFKIDGEPPLIDVLYNKLPRPSSEKTADSTTEPVCLISGKNASAPSTHSKIKGVWGAQSAGGSLVAFNLDASESFGKEQNLNAPISEEAADAYVKALNMLLDKDSQNRIQVGDASTVFWADKEAEFEKYFPFFFSTSKDDPDRDILAVKSLYQSIDSGAAVSESKTSFFVLGLSPNAARISVRFWHTGTISSFSQKIKQHFDDLDIVRGPKDTGRYSLYRHLTDIVLEKKAENILPNLSGNMTRAILAGLPYPSTLLQQTVRRIRAEQEVTRIRASLLKAYLNRYHRIHKTSEQEITVSLDPNNINPGYRLGRLFAILEVVQEESHKPATLNSTIRDRFYGAASSSPTTVFPQLLKLKNHHLAKIERTDYRRRYENIITEIFSGLSVDMPAHLNMEDQARFAIGYYHQRQALFTKSDKSSETQEN